MPKPFRIFKFSDDAYGFDVMSGNNEVICASTTLYKTKQGVMKRIKTLCAIIHRETQSNLVDGECNFDNLIEDET